MGLACGWAVGRHMGPPLAASWYTPQPDGGVRAAGGDAQAIWRPGAAPDLALVPAEHRQLLSARGVPEVDNAIPSRLADDVAVGRPHNDVGPAPRLAFERGEVLSCCRAPEL